MLVTVCVGATLGVLWVLDIKGRILVRHGISEGNLMGDQWKVLPSIRNRPNHEILVLDWLITSHVT